MKPRISSLLVGICCILGMIATVSTGRSDDERIHWQVLSSGGKACTSGNFKLNGTMGQAAAGPVRSSSHKVNHGFWQDFSTGGTCCDLAGDANNNGIRNILDVTYLISFLYKGGPQHPDCHPDEMDASGNEVVNILDATYIIAFLYKSGPAPVCP